jgi:hypothetical protein
MTPEHPRPTDVQGFAGAEAYARLQSERPERHQPPELAGRPLEVRARQIAVNAPNDPNRLIGLMDNVTIENGRAILDLASLHIAGKATPEPGTTSPIVEIQMDLDGHNNILDYNVDQLHQLLSKPDRPSPHVS